MVDLRVYGVRGGRYDLGLPLVAWLLGRVVLFLLFLLARLADGIVVFNRLLEFLLHLLPRVAK